MRNRKRVMIFTDWFYPGYNAGGPVKSIYTLVQNLGRQVDFYIVTSDRELGGDKSYDNIKPGEWQNAYGARILYLPPEKQKRKFIQNLLADNYDIVYVNGMYSPVFSLFPVLTFNALRQKVNSRLIVSPRGMLGPGSVKIKAYKKRPYLWLARIVGWYKNAAWHATSVDEEAQIRHYISAKAEVIVAENFILNEGTRPILTVTDQDEMKLVFLSRICVIKNLDYALNILANYKKAAVIFDIYGPVEDRQYWEKCRSIISRLPANIKVNYKGEVHPSEIPKMLSGYHGFFFPTKHENFGHTIAEALQAGLFVIISDNTPWNDVDRYDVGRAISLNESEKFLEALDECRVRIPVDKWEINNRYINKKINRETLVRLYEKLFQIT